LTVKENAGRPENYRFLKYIYYLLEFTKYVLSVNTNSGFVPEKK
jgi:hypothetical protein